MPAAGTPGGSSAAPTTLPPAAAAAAAAAVRGISKHQVKTVQPGSAAAQPDLALMVNTEQMQRVLLASLHAEVSVTVLHLSRCCCCCCGCGMPMPQVLCWVYRVAAAFEHSVGICKQLAYAY
jgi:hypothetical protein